EGSRRGGAAAGAEPLGQRGRVPPEPVGAQPGGVVGLGAAQGGVGGPHGVALGRPGAAAFARGPAQGFAAGPPSSGDFAGRASPATDTKNPEAAPQPHTTGGLKTGFFRKCRTGGWP